MKKIILLIILILFSSFVYALDFVSVEKIEFEPTTVSVGDEVTVKVSVRNMSKVAIRTGATLQGDFVDNDFWDGTLEPNEVKEVFQTYPIEEIEVGTKSVTVNFPVGQGEDVIGNNSKKGYFTVLEKKLKMVLQSSQ